MYNIPKEKTPHKEYKNNYTLFALTVTDKTNAIISNVT